MFSLRNKYNKLNIQKRYWHFSQLGLNFKYTFFLIILINL